MIISSMNNALLLSQADAWLPTNLRGYALIIFFLLPSMPFFADHDLCHFLQNTVPTPRARVIAYKIAGPISALGFKSTTLAQLMSRYATMDPTPISSTSDKRKAPSSVAPSAAKKKRTTKKALIEVISLPS
jgi:hypothetical protein